MTPTNPANVSSTPTPPRSPCIGICQIDDHGTCSGCYRTLDEIGRWSIASNTEKHAILAKLRERRWQRSGTLPS